MDGPPPPPPPHGEKPNTTHGEYRKSSDLPPGNYDIFIIPPHSSGSGFLYLPSLQCQRNSFIAGSVCTLVVVYLWVTLSPMLKIWYALTVANGGGTGIALLAIAVVGVAGWAFGMSQAGYGGASREGRWGPGFRPSWFGSGGPGGAGGAGSNAGGNSGGNYSRGGNFGGQSGGPHQQGNYGGNFGGGPPPGNQYSGNQYRANTEPPPQTNTGPNGPNPGPESGPGPRPSPSPGPGPTPGPNPNANSGAKPEGSPPKSESKPQPAEDWEREREEARRKEELRRKMEEFKRKREAEAREKQRQREREAMEKELRERREQLEKEMAAAKEAAAREARLQAQKEAAEARARVEREAAEAKARAEREAAEARRREAEARAKVEREAAEARAKAEREAAEAKARAEKEAAEKEAAAKAAAKKEADAKFAALKEAAAKKYAEKKARDAQEAAAAAAATTSKVSSASAPPRTPSPKKPTVPPSSSSSSRASKATAAADDDAYSFRPYDRPRRPYAGTSQSSVYSESSYAPSQSTARTTPPPSNRGVYETKDPDKIVIKGVYAFNQAFLRTPVAQLVSGQGMVTDGLVLRITTEGLFIDDDVRGVPQREWDVKAWTMKLVEVWCPQIGSSSSSSSASSKPNAQKVNQAFFRRSTNGDPTPEESDAYLANFLKVCKNTCRLASPAFLNRHHGSDNTAASSKDPAAAHPWGGLHVLRATIRDQESRRYVFVLQETEGWKVALGLQRLRRGTQVRALGVCSMALAETRTILGGLGY